MFRRSFLLCLGALALIGSAIAEPLSKKTDIDFFRDVPSRNLKGLATRSDGRLVGGPTLTEFTSPAPADLLWCLEPTPEPAKFLVGTGPDGRVLELTLDAAQANFTTREIVKLDAPQIFALKRLADGSLLAGTSPRGGLYLIRDGKVTARVALPVDSIFDLLVLSPTTVLVATGNPGRIYRVEIDGPNGFAAAGIIADKITDAKILADKGITLFGEVRDRNVRRIALAGSTVVAGSSPKGNVYRFPNATSAGKSGPIEPVILQENRDAEVTDLLPQPNGACYATIVYSSTSGESRITPSGSSSKSGRDNRENNNNSRDETPPPVQVERFAGRSALILFPADGFPETLAVRASTAFYHAARHGDIVLIAGGEQGELVGYDLKTRLSLTFAGSISAQLNSLVPITGTPGKFLILRNNAPGLALLDFNANGPREAETRRLDLNTPAQLGALRFNRLRQVAEENLKLEVRTSNGSDEVEGWGPWTSLNAAADAGWRADSLRGRYVKLRLRVADAPNAAAFPNSTTPAPTRPNLAGLEIDRAALYALPQNRRPQLQDFRVLTPGYGVIAAAEQTPSPVTSIARLIESAKEDERRRSNFLSSQVVPSPGAQVVIWTITDPDGDNLLSTFSIRRDGEANWTDVAASTRESYVQFDTAHLTDGVYFTRLVATETAPRPSGERLSQTFETDDLIVDHGPPEMLEAAARRTNETIVVTVHGRDRLTLLDGIEVVFNNGVRETVEQPADGVRDGREETFTLEIPLARVSNATSVEVTLYDSAGNGTAKRLNW